MILWHPGREGEKNDMEDVIETNNNWNVVYRSDESIISV